MRRANSVRHYRRLQAVALVAEGWSAAQAAKVLKGTRRWIFKCLAMYGRRHRPEDLIEKSRGGRPLKAGSLSREQILAELQCSPLECGYSATVWTVPLLRMHLHERYGSELSESTLRRRLHEIGLRWKRPRYIFSGRDPNRAQKKGASFAG